VTKFSPFNKENMRMNGSKESIYPDEGFIWSGLGLGEERVKKEGVGKKKN